MNIVDIGKPSSWPGQVCDIIDSAIARAPEPDWRDYPFDNLGLPEFERDEYQLRRALRNYRITGYHATRLLPHEVTNIKTIGLEILTECLRQRKARDARKRYPQAFDEDPRASDLLMSGPNNWQGTAEVRLGSCHFVAPFILFESDDAYGLVNVLDTWGGETLGWRKAGRGSGHTLRYLTRKGIPAIIEVAVRVSTVNTWNPLLPAFAGALKQVPGNYWSEWTTTETVPPEFVLDIITIASDRWPQGLQCYRE